MQILHRLEGDRAHFLTVTWWESREAIAAFAGEDIEIAKYYPEDQRFLLEFERTVTHWETSLKGGGAHFTAPVVIPEMK